MELVFSRSERGEGKRWAASIVVESQGRELQTNTP